MNTIKKTTEMEDVKIQCEDEAFSIMGSADVAVHICRSFFII